MEEWENLFNILGSSCGNGKEDSWKWLGDKSDSFSVASVRGWMHEDLEVVNNYVKWVPSKCSIFMWGAEMNKLPTLDARRRRNIQIDSSTCSLCETADETVEHLLIGCEVANAIWSFVASWCKVPPIFGFSVRDIMKFHTRVNLFPSKKYALQGIIIVASWSIERKDISAKRG
ncbi:putative reverse transcriptase zinc-binding domain-containing protein [Helianthus anomalus]